MKTLLVLIVLILTIIKIARAIEDVDVVIVGMGITGTSAAHEARVRGLTFVVLEATNIIGGRVNTTYGPDLVKFPHPVEMGGAWVHDQYVNPLYPVLNDLGVPMVIFNQDDSSVWDNGKLESSGQVKNLVKGATAVLTQTDACRQIGLSDTAARLACGYDGSNNEYETYFQFAGEQWIGNNLEYHDSKAWDFSNTDLGPDHIVPGGYITAINALVDQPPSIRSNIRFNSVVTNIDYSSPSGKVIVTYRNGGVTKYIRANRRVVVTVSINVLKSNDITFVPLIPNTHVAAMNELMCSEVNKVAMFFDDNASPMLSRADLSHNYMFRYGKGTNPRINDALTCFINWRHFNGQNVVTSYYMGDYSRLLETLSNEEIQSRHLIALKEIIPDLPNPIYWEITRWGKHPYSKCSYTDVKVGGSVTAFNRLAVPFGPNNNVILSGEASNFPLHGTVHAGWLSGKQSIESIPQY